MLILSRKANEAILIGDVVVRVFRVGENAVKLGIDAPADVEILREELGEKGQQDDGQRTD